MVENILTNILELKIKTSQKYFLPICLFKDLLIYLKAGLQREGETERKKVILYLQIFIPQLAATAKIKPV